MSNPLSPPNSACPGRHSAPFLQHIVDALGRLQVQTDTPVPENIYVYDLVEQQTLSATASTASLLGYTPEEVDAMGPMGLASLMHPQDLDRVAAHYQRFSALLPGEVIRVEYRMQHANGTWCWVRSQETTLVQAVDGFPLQILGTVQVMTQLAAPDLQPPDRFKERYPFLAAAIPESVTPTRQPYR